MKNEIKDCFSKMEKMYDISLFLVSLTLQKNKKRIINDKK